MLRPSTFMVFLVNPFHGPAGRERQESEGICELVWALQKPRAKGGGGSWEVRWNYACGASWAGVRETLRWGDFSFSAPTLLK